MVLNQVRMRMVLSQVRMRMVLNQVRMSNGMQHYQNGKWLCVNISWTKIVLANLLEHYTYQIGSGSILANFLEYYYTYQIGMQIDQGCVGQIIVFSRRQISRRQTHNNCSLLHLFISPIYQSICC